MSDSTTPCGGTPASSIEAVLADDPTTWKPWIYASLAERSREALAGSKEQLKDLSRLLNVAWGTAWQNADVETRKALLSQENPSQLQAAYRLGQLGFARLLIGQANGRRADDDFAEVVLNEENGPIMRAIAAGDDTTTRAEMSTLLGLTEVQLRAILRVLIDKGAVDFRGPAPVRYFLTPVGCSLMKKIGAMA